MQPSRLAFHAQSSLPSSPPKQIQSYRQAPQPALLNLAAVLVAMYGAGQDASRMLALVEALSTSSPPDLVGQPEMVAAYLGM
jgi:hypothetical protein